MAENDQAQEKTEEPTQRRLEKAREDGDVLSSKEMFVFASSIAGLFVLMSIGFFSGNILQGWAALFEFSHPEELLTLKVLHAWQSYKLLLVAAAIFGLPCFLFIVGMQAFVGSGLSVSGKALGFEIKNYQRGKKISDLKFWSKIERDFEGCRKFIKKRCANNSC